ncbi:hypothetical protein N9J99_00375 [Methylophilaceae bacterium]|nr:hypothetical protein [Methylophilaceae bacterium]
MLDRTFKLKITFIYIGIKVLGTLFALFIFNRFTPLIDSINYINGFYDLEIHFRTLFVQRITTTLVTLTTPLITHIIFSLFSASAIFYYALKSKNNSWLLLILLLPTALTWTSIVGKEAIYFGGVGIFLILWIDLIKEKISYRHLLIIISLGLCAILRPHYTISLLWLAFSAFIIQNNRVNNRLIVFAFIIIIVGILFFLMPELAIRGITSIDETARASRHLALNIHTLEAFKSHMSTGMLFGIVGPFPSELLHRLEFIPFFIEGIAILIAPFAIGILIFKKTRETKNHIYFLNFMYGVVPAIIILLLVHAPFGILNPGSAIRWRVNFELIFYMAPLLLLLEVKKNDN